MSEYSEETGIIEEKESSRVPKHFNSNEWNVSLVQNQILYMAGRIYRRSPIQLGVMKYSKASGRYCADSFS